MISSGSKTKLQQLLDNIPSTKTNKRMDCPSCGGKNTFSITNLGAVVLFYCFSASCELRGKRKIDLTIDNLKESLLDSKDAPNPSFFLDTFLFIPEMTGPARIETYLRDNNCWDAYNEGRADIRYDPYRDRIVFMIYELAAPISAIGRGLSETAIPKWLRYGKKSKPFICSKDVETISQTLVIVEDCCSACAASVYSDSAALLGTYLQDAYLKEFLTYDKFIIALDKDASKLAFKMQKELQVYKPTKILLLEEDLKVYDADGIRSLFNV